MRGWQHEQRPANWRPASLRSLSTGCRWFTMASTRAQNRAASSGATEPSPSPRHRFVFQRTERCTGQSTPGRAARRWGWNCEAPKSRRSSFHTTICVLEGLLEYERAGRKSAAVTKARKRAENYLLERRMFRSLRTGEVIDKRWLRFSFPMFWHNDVLRGLDYLRNARIKPDSRISEATARAPSSALVQQLNVAVVTWACSRNGLGQKVAANLPFGADYGQTFPNLLPKVCRPSADDSTSITQVAGRLDNGCGTWLRIGVNC
jgi:hypothetical protein